MPRRRRIRPNLPLFFAMAIFLLAVATYIGLGVLLAAMTPRRVGMPSDLSLALIARSLDATIAVWFFAVGASIGSFLNVVAYRLPLGRTLGGHSACPYCCTPIAALDNIPVFAWIRLRGRCRTCHLPISVQYPLVELAVGLVFLAVYFTEFGVAGSNLPGSSPSPVGLGLVWMSVTKLLAIRVLLFVFTLSGLIAAALMTMHAARPPWSLFACVLAVVGAASLAMPDVIIVPWWPIGLARSGALPVVDASLTLGLGLVAALLMAALTLPYLQRVTQPLPWSGALASVGLLVGWQWQPFVTSSILLATLLGHWTVRSGWKLTGTLDPVVWSWLGLLVFRAGWSQIEGLVGSHGSHPTWTFVGLSVLATIPLAWLVGWNAWRQSGQEVSVTAQVGDHAGVG